MSIASMSDAMGGILPFDLPTLLFQVLAHSRPQIALQLDGVLCDGAARAAGALELLCELFQERLVLRKVVDDSDGFAAAPFLFHAQLRGDATRDRLVGAAFRAALAVFRRPPASRAHLADPCGIHDPPV